MPPAMHPRSFFTTSLFTTTALLSFAVVSVPHVLPCPAPKVVLAEASDDTSKTNPKTEGKECPIPKPMKIAEKIMGGEAVTEQRAKVEIVERR